MEEAMKLIKMKRQKSLRLYLGAAITATFLIAFAVTAIAFGAAAPQKTFPSAEEAVKAGIAAVKGNDNKELLAILGDDAKDLISSGDPVADKANREQFLKAYDEKHQLIKEGDNYILTVGKQDWPYPIPVVKKGNRWGFDTAQGREEILNRRIGENELSTIQVLLAIVDAQREYASKDRDGDGVLAYAQKFGSDPGKKNGLYWEAKPGEEQSPLGEMVAKAWLEGYRATSSVSNTPAYHGYYYKILTAQGKNAPGGAYSYLVKNELFGGFAVIAAPAEYGNSGVMTFLVNHDGVLYKKDLGKNTLEIAKKISSFDPDKGWKKIDQVVMP
jgi:hypothetical protein